MLRTLWSRVIDSLGGDAGRAAQFTRDDRRAIPGWPVGLDLATQKRRIVARTVADRDQHALPLFWDEAAVPPVHPARHFPFAVIDGGRSAGASART